MNKLFDFVKRLQVDIQGSLSSAAQVKASSMNLATNTREASDEVSLLKNIIQMVRSDIESMSPNQMQGITQRHVANTMRSTNLENPWLDHTPGRDIAQHHVPLSGNLIELQNQLSAALYLKSTLERDLNSVRQELIDTKAQSREENEVLSSTNQKMELKLQKTEQELKKMKSKVSSQEKELSSWKSKHKHETDQNKEEI